MADRNLDKLIATEVLGYVVFSPWEGQYFMASSAWAMDEARGSDGGVSEFLSYYSSDSMAFCVELPHFDRISGAWQIMERFATGHLGEDVKQEFFSKLDGVALHRLAAREAALTVCRAACETMGVEIGV